MNRSNKETPHAVLSDEIIIELYCGRSEQAIIETDKKYKKTGCPNGQPVFVCVFYVLVLCRASGHRTDISPEQ